MSFATMARRAAAVAVLALALALPVAAAQAGASVPVTVRTDGAGSTAVYTVGITPQGTAPAPAQTSLQIKNGGTAYFTGLPFDEPGDYTYRVAQAKGSAPTFKLRCPRLHRDGAGDNTPGRNLAHRALGRAGRRDGQGGQPCVCEPL